MTARDRAAGVPGRPFESGYYNQVTPGSTTRSCGVQRTRPSSWGVVSLVTASLLSLTPVGSVGGVGADAHRDDQGDAGNRRAGDPVARDAGSGTTQGTRDAGTATPERLQAPETQAPAAQPATVTPPAAPPRPGIRKPVQPRQEARGTAGLVPARSRLASAARGAARGVAGPRRRQRLPSAEDESARRGVAQGRRRPLDARRRDGHGAAGRRWQPPLSGRRRHAGSASDREWRIDLARADHRRRVGAARRAGRLADRRARQRRSEGAQG